MNLIPNRLRHPEAIRVCKVLGLDWLKSGWYLGWSVS